MRKLGALALAVVATLTMAGCPAKDDAAKKEAQDAHSTAPTALPKGRNCKPKVETFTTSKKKDDKIIIVPEGRQGFRITVQLACVDDTDNIWLFTRNVTKPADDEMYMVDGVNGAPGYVATGSFVHDYLIQPIGHDGVDNQTYQLTVVVSPDSACEKSLSSILPDSKKNYWVKHDRLPKTCQVAGNAYFKVIKY